MENIYAPEFFSVTLFEKMKHISPAIVDLELYEFQYGLKNITPVDGWKSIQPDTKEEIENRVNSCAFYDSIQIKHRVEDRIVLAEQIVRLTNMLFVGLVTGAYAETWINEHFYFDARGFFFLHRTTYFTEKVLAHLGGEPFRQFEQKQKVFERFQGVGYKDFMEANRDLDKLFIESVHKIIASRGTPILLAVAGPTAAGKTEIVERLRADFEGAGKKTTSIELDNFLTDRDYREEKGIFTQGKEALHFELFKQSLKDITDGKKISISRYDFVYATSSHDLDGNLKPNGKPIEIEPADIIFIEGNFPFLIEEVAHLIGIKVVYLTDDPIRLKRKWKRDIDYRKKYEPTYFRNRYFKDQFIMAGIAYRPQMEICDMVVDTTGAAPMDNAGSGGGLDEAEIVVPTNVEAILFDMNGTLRVREAHEQTQRAAFARLEELIGRDDINWDELALRQKSYGDWAQANLIQLSEAEIWSRWMLPDVPLERIESVAAELTLAWSERKGRTAPILGVEAMLVGLQQRGYRLGIISNTMSTLDIPRCLESFGWERYFDVVILSSSLKVRKPSPEPFREAARRMKLSPGLCAYLGNRISRDVVGCKRAGFALGLIIEPSSGPRADERCQTIAPDIVIHSLSELLDIFPARV